MEEIIGLDYLLDKIDSYTLDTLPHSLILVGKEGSGKHVVSKYISNHFNLNLLDISENLSEELIYNIYRNPTPRLYMVDLRKITEKDQNILLKLFEEPSSNTFVVLLTNSVLGVLPTILNRGQSIKIDNYRKEDLQKYGESHNINIDPKYYGSVIETPGDVLKIQTLNIDLDKIKELTDKIINKLNIASYANTLTIVDKLNFKDEYDKLDVDFFLKVLYHDSVENYIQGNKETLKIVNIVSDNIKKMADTRLNKKVFISHLLSELWLGVR